MALELTEKQLSEFFSVLVFSRFQWLNHDKVTISSVLREVDSRSTSWGSKSSSVLPSLKITHQLSGIILHDRLESRSLHCMIV